MPFFERGDGACGEPALWRLNNGSVFQESWITNSDKVFAAFSALGR